MPGQIVTRIAARWVLGAVLALCPLAGYSLGLGKLQMKSALNEPLDAEIDITSISDSELKGLNVSLAPRADFEAAGADRIPVLSQIKFTVARRPDGSYYLKLHTEAPIEEPFLHVLLQLEWPGGRLVREYTALIDPPTYVAGSPATVDSPQTAAPQTTAPAPSSVFVETVPPPMPAGTESSDAQLAAPSAPIPEPLAARPPEPDAVPPEALSPPKEVTVVASEQAAAPPSPRAAAPAQTPAPAGDWSNSVEYTVRPGDTLWRIAERVRGDKQLTLEQVMLAIFRNNPDAFYRDNVNNLRAGKVLTMPERDAVAAMPAPAARREFRAQYDAWQEYKLRLAAGSRTLKVAESAAAPAEPAKAEPDAAAKMEPKAEAKTAAKADAKSGPGVADGKGTDQAEDLLKIVRAADADKTSAGEKKAAETESAPVSERAERTALADRVTTLEESLQSKQLENRELAEKVGQVRSQIKNEKRLIEIENEALAQQTAKPAEAKPDASKPEPGAKPETKAEPAPPAEPKKEAAPAPAPPVKAAPRKPIPRPAPPPPPEKGFIESLIDDLLSGSFLPLLAGVVVLAGGAIMMVYMRRRRRSIAEFEESILASDAIATETAPTTAETTGQVTTGDTSFLSDFSKGGMGQVHTDEVDPVAEAEVYLAYGRDETAEEILKEAIIKNPERHELKQKLLEIYHQRNDVNAFETLAEELYAAIGGRGGKIWEKVEELGRKLNPDNPMFRGGAPERRAAAPSERAQGMPSASFDENTDDLSLLASGGTAGSVAATQVVDKSSSIDFDLNTPVSAAPAENSLDFDLNADLTADDAGTEQAGGGNDFESLDLGAPADNVIDFDGGKSDAAAATAEPEAEVDLGAALADDEIKWEMDASASAAAAEETADAGNSGGNGADGHWDETATKLDLAKAYIDMGDAEGARSILDEVLAEGNEQQKQQAAELAAQIA